MQDDSPWKPPPDGGDDAGAPVLPPATPPLPRAPEPAVPPAPVPPAPVPPTDAASATAPAPVSDDVADDELLVASSASSEPVGRPRRSKWLVGGATAAILATGAAGIFAVSNLTGAPQGGADSPDTLDLTLLEAIENEDVLGVIDVLSPGEREIFRDPLVDLVAELTRLEVLSADADLSRILGVDVEFSNEAVTATSTNVPDITNIDLRADAVVTFDGAELPIGALITDNLPDDMLTEMRGTRQTETDELDVRLTAVEEDGRWYFSVFHTIAELAREELGPGTLIPLQGIGADGAETPTAAFDGVLDRVEAFDLTGLLRTLNPGEAAALQRYAPLFLEEAEAALDEAPLRWEITRRDFRVDEAGDAATVFLDAIAVEGVADEGAFSFEFADGCVRAEAEDTTFEQCNDTTFDDVDGVFEELPESKELIDVVTAAFADMEDVGLELRRTDGLWYVSPSSTLSEAVLAVLAALDRSELDAIVDQARAAGEELFDVLLGGFESLPGGFELGDGFDDEVAAPLPDEPSTDGNVIGGAGGTIAPRPEEACYEEPDAQMASECFRSVVERGEFDASLVPIALRFPECGYEASWGGGFYTLPDDEFIAAAEAARPCFLDLLDRGEVSEYELPNEIMHLECFEGRNWYQVFDDPAYDERYAACLEAAWGQ